MARFAALSLLICLVLAGCSRRETPAAAGVRTQTLLLGNFAEPADIDPQLVDAFTDSNIDYALFEPLTMLDERTGLPQPAAARSWDVSGDGKVYTFHLRPEGHWSNGDPVTASDFAYSFQRILTPALAVSYSYMLWPIKNAHAYNAGTLKDFSQVGVKVIDPLTLQISLDKPTPYLPALAAHNTWMPVPKATIEKFGGDFVRGNGWTRPGNIVSNGPFTLESWIPNGRLVVVKNPRYWDAAHVRLNSIVFFPIENSETEELDFRVGQVHETFNLPISKVQVYRNRQPPVLRVDPWLSDNFLLFNVTHPPLDNVKVRRALSMAIDREAISRDILAGVRKPGYTLTVPNCGGYTPRAKVTTNFDEARKLLAEAGYPGGKGLPVLEFQTYTLDFQQKIVEAIQAMWLKELGVHVTIAPIEQKTLFQNEQNLHFQIGFCGWAADYPDPSTFLNQYITGGGNNWTGWSNKEFDGLISEAENTADNSKRFEIFQKAEKILLDESPIAPVYYDSRVYLLDPAVHGWEPSMIGTRQYKKVWLEN